MELHRVDGDAEFGGKLGVGVNRPGIAGGSNS